MASAVRPDGGDLRALGAAGPQLGTRADRPHRPQDHPHGRVRAALLPLVARAPDGGVTGPGDRAGVRARRRVRRHRRAAPAFGARSPRFADRHRDRRDRGGPRRAGAEADPGMTMRRLPIGSMRPVAGFALVRVSMVVVTIVALLVFDVPDGDKLLLLTAAVALPLALGVAYLARRAPTVALNPVIALADLGILAAAEAIAPASYAAVRFLALFVIAAHAHFQGEFRGGAIALAAIILLVPIA